MKLTLDERVKHRLIGLAVMFSIAAIFAPAMIKKSNQRLDENTTLFVKLPPKPTLPKVVMPEEQAMFQKVKVTKAEIPKIPAGPRPTELTLSRAETLKPRNQELEKNQLVTIQEKKLSHPLSEDMQSDLNVLPNSESKINPIRTIPSIPLQSKNAKIKFQENKKKSLSFSESKIKKNSSKLLSNSKKESYLVQLASFSKKQNAESLISRLRARGYQASYNKVTTSRGMVYQVLVGQTAEKQQAQILKKQLAAATRLNGLIVTTSIG